MLYFQRTYLPELTLCVAHYGLEVIIYNHTSPTINYVINCYSTNINYSSIIKCLEWALVEHYLRILRYFISSFFSCGFIHIDTARQKGWGSIASNVTENDPRVYIKHNLTHVHTASQPSECPITSPRLQHLVQRREFWEPLKPSIDCIIIATIPLRYYTATLSV